MPLFEITKPLTAILLVESETEQEAINWVDKIVADIQDENGIQIQSKSVISFEADVKVSEIRIEILQNY